MPLDGMAIFGDKDAVTVSKPGEAEGRRKHVYADSMLFEEMRMQVQNERSSLKDQLQTKMLSSDLTAEEKNAAYDANGGTHKTYICRNVDGNSNKSTWLSGSIRS